MQKWYYFLCLIVLMSCNNDNKNAQQQPANLKACYQLKPLSVKKLAPQPHEWLYERVDEQGQSLKNYIQSKPLSANTNSNKLYLVKLGAFDSSAHQVFVAVKDYLSAYFQIETDTLPGIQNEQMPKAQQRQNNGALQWKTGYFLEEILPQVKPEDALALIGFSSVDLYPDENWNFVFGQASLRNGVGVWSLARLGINDAAVPFAKVLYRALKIASHEMGHMLSMPHCVKYECNMNGSNSLEESDGQVEWLCWECLAKLCFNRNIPPQQHLKDMTIFHQKNAATPAIQNYYKQALSVLDEQ